EQVEDRRGRGSGLGFVVGGVVDVVDVGVVELVGELVVGVAHASEESSSALASGASSAAASAAGSSAGCSSALGSSALASSALGAALGFGASGLWAGAGAGASSSAGWLSATLMSRATVSVGWAPLAIQSWAFSVSILTTDGSCRGS